MGRKRKYFTEEEAREAQNRRRRKDYLFGRQFEATKGSVLMAMQIFKLYFDQNQMKVKYDTIQNKDIYMYALIGVDATINGLMSRLYGFNKENFKASSITNSTLNLLANQLRFREWLINKANLSTELGKGFDDAGQNEKEDDDEKIHKD